MLQDIRSNLLPELSFNSLIGSPATVNGPAISTADYELGITFNPFLTTYVDGSFDFQVEESDDIGFSSPSVIPAERIIGTPPTLTALSTPGSQLGSFGVLTSKPYIRVQCVATGVTGSATVLVVSNKKAEVAPAVS